MKQTPLLLKTPMVQAYIAGLKTQTRRGLKSLLGLGQITDFGVSDTRGYEFHFRDKAMRWHDVLLEHVLQCCPYGGPGDMLWVKETWSASEHWDSDEGRTVRVVSYKASDGRNPNFRAWKPSLFMSRADSRFSLPIVDVRFERLRDISEHDALAEGIFELDDCYFSWPGHDDGYNTARDAYFALSASINGEAHVAQNPFVWVIEFERYKGEA